MFKFNAENRSPSSDDSGNIEQKITRNVGPFETIEIFTKTPEQYKQDLIAKGIKISNEKEVFEIIDSIKPLQEVQKIDIAQITSNSVFDADDNGGRMSFGDFCNSLESGGGLLSAENDSRLDFPLPQVALELILSGSFEFKNKRLLFPSKSFEKNKPETNETYYDFLYVSQYDSNSPVELGVFEASSYSGDFLGSPEDCIFTIKRESE